MIQLLATLLFALPLESLCFATYPPPPPFLNNVFGDHMVLQRDTPSVVVYGFASPGSMVNTTMAQTGGSGVSYVLQTRTGDDGIWRQQLASQEASRIDGSNAWNFSIAGEGGINASMVDVLFGDVHMCSGQSNMQYTLRLGFNASEECALTPLFPGIRMMSIYDNRSATPRTYIWPTYLLSWAASSPEVVCPGGWGYMSAACYYTYRSVYTVTGVPQGLISNSFGGSYIEEWMSSDAMAMCPLPDAPPAAPCPSNVDKAPSDKEAKNTLALAHNAAANTIPSAPSCVSAIFNVMVTPFLVGPMPMRTLLFYQGESNVNTHDAMTTQNPAWYACAASAIVSDYRKKIPGLSTFGAFQLAGCTAPCYSATTLNLSDLRAAQAAPLKTTSRFAFTTAADAANFSDPTNIHYPVKQVVSQRMANQILALEYGLEPNGPTAIPMFSNAEQVGGGNPSQLRVHVNLTGCTGTQAGIGGSAATGTAATGCELRSAACPVADESQCAGFQVRIDGAGPNGTAAWVPSTAATVLPDGHTVEVIVPGSGVASGVAYGRANWPLMTLYAQGSGLPVLPFCVTLGSASTQQCYEAGI